ncbi:MAG TPA: TadE/TadG family type IV pilus assembly protein [Sphingobium sp.]|nr:TadE/TadG family type IV pilus assembly protein [Sphingobium sp.]
MRRLDQIFRRCLTCERGIAALEFILIAPALLMIAFAIIVYSFYFSVDMGLRHAASEGARAATAGLGSVERANLARARAQAVVQNYGSLLMAGGAGPVITTVPDGVSTFKVEVSYNMANSPIMRFAGFLPLPSPTITATAVVTNGGY